MLKNFARDYIRLNIRAKVNARRKRTGVDPIIAEGEVKEICAALKESVAVTVLLSFDE
jgi:hypothetical protein